MNNEIIDVDFKDVVDTASGGDVVINADPTSTVIHGITSAIKTFSDNAREYKIAQEHEKTQRAAIKANMRVAMEEINSRKEVVLKQLDDDHQRKMFGIQAQYAYLTKELDEYIESIRSIRKCAEEEKDFKFLIECLNSMSNIITLRSDERLKLIDSTTTEIPTAFLGYNSPKGYLN